MLGRRVRLSSSLTRLICHKPSDVRCSVGKDKLPEEKIKKIRELRHQGMPYAAIAKEVGVSAGTARKYSLDIVGDNLSKRTKVSDYKRQRVLRLRAEGLTYRKIAEETGVALYTARYICKETEYRNARRALHDSPLEVNLLYKLQRLVRKVHCVGCEHEFLFLASQVHVRCPKCLLAFKVQHRVYGE